MTDAAETPIAAPRGRISADSTDAELRAHLGAKGGEILNELRDRTFRAACLVRDTRDPNTGQVVSDYREVDRWLAEAAERQFLATPEGQFRILLALEGRIRGYRAELVQQAADREAEHQRACAEQRRRDAPAMLIAEFERAGFTVALAADGDGLLLIRQRPTSVLPPAHTLRLGEHKTAIVSLLRERAAAAEAATAWRHPIAVA